MIILQYQQQLIKDQQQHYKNKTRELQASIIIPTATLASIAAAASGTFVSTKILTSKKGLTTNDLRELLNYELVNNEWAYIAPETGISYTIADIAPLAAPDGNCFSGMKKYSSEGLGSQRQYNWRNYFGGIRVFFLWPKFVGNRIIPVPN